MSLHFVAFLYMHYSLVMEHQSRRGETLKNGCEPPYSTRRRLGFLKVLLVLRWPLPHSFRAPRSTFIVHSLLASLTTDYKSRLKFTLLLFVGRLKTLFFIRSWCAWICNDYLCEEFLYSLLSFVGLWMTSWFVFRLSLWSPSSSWCILVVPHFKARMRDLYR